MTDDSSAMHRVGETVDQLGESPVWSVAEQALYWIDIRGPVLRRLNPESGASSSWRLPELVGSIALRAKGGLLVALASRIVVLDTTTGQMDLVASPHKGREGMRFNDGRCDREGRFWVGSMHDVDRGPTGTLYRLDGEGCAPVLGNVAIPNSLCCSPDGRTLYFSDGRDSVIQSLPLSPRGDLGPPRLFARLTPGSGDPDGATVDDEGFIWSAHYGGSRLTRYRPDGAIDRTVSLPVSQPTSCAFGGPNLEILFITTAAQKLSAKELTRQPFAGGLLAFRPGVRGLPEAYFGS